MANASAATGLSIPRLVPVIGSFLPIIHSFASGRFAVSIGGSHGKGTFDERSDVDFRLFCDSVNSSEQNRKALNDAVNEWRIRGVDVDHCWIRKISDIDAMLDGWLSGTAKPIDMVWTIWGYHVLTDIYNQLIVEDPDGVIAGWKARLARYPLALKKAIIEKHAASLRYWRNDYHYENKAKRGDPVFLAGLAARLVHDVMQLLYALNETYFPGDGKNLDLAASFHIQPRDLRQRVAEALYPPAGDLALQRRTVIALIDDVLPLADAHLPK